MVLPGVPGIVRLLQRKPAADVRNVEAYSGLRVYAGSIVTDYNPDCRGVKWFETVDKMRSYPRVQAAESLMILPVQYANPRFELPATSRSTAAKEAQELLTRNLFEECRMNFVDVVRLALLARLYGVRVLVPQWTVRDGLVIVDDILDLLPHTYYQWKFENQRPVALVQQAMDPDTGEMKRVEIPLEQAIRFTWREEGGNPEGRSDARAAYPHWYTITFIESVVRVAIERAGIGAWKGTVSRELWENQTLRNEVKNILKALRSHQEGAVVLPEQVQIDVITAVEKQGVSVLTDVWDRFMREMTNALFASIFNVGMTDLGTSAWAEQLIRLAVVSLNSSARWLSQCVNNQLVRKWMQFNYPGLPPSEHPNLVFDDVMLVLSPRTLLDAWNMATQAGNLPRDDSELQKYMASVLGLPQPASTAQQTAMTAEEPDEIVLLSGRATEADFEMSMRDFLETVTADAQKAIAATIEEIRRSQPMQQGTAIARLQSLELKGLGQYEELLRKWLWRFFITAQQRVAKEYGQELPAVSNAMRQWLNVKSAAMARDHYENLRARLVYEALDMALSSMPANAISNVVGNSIREHFSSALQHDLMEVGNELLEAINRVLA